MKFQRHSYDNQRLGSIFRKYFRRLLGLPAATTSRAQQQKPPAERGSAGKVMNVIPLFSDQLVNYERLVRRYGPGPRSAELPIYPSFPRGEVEREANSLWQMVGKLSILLGSRLLHLGSGLREHDTTIAGKAASSWVRDRKIPQIACLYPVQQTAYSTHGDRKRPMSVEGMPSV